MTQDEPPFRILVSLPKFFFYFIHMIRNIPYRSQSRANKYIGDDHKDDDNADNEC